MRERDEPGDWPADREDPDASDSFPAAQLAALLMTRQASQTVGHGLASAMDLTRHETLNQHGSTERLSMSVICVTGQDLKLTIAGIGTEGRSPLPERQLRQPGRSRDQVCSWHVPRGGALAA